MPLSLALWAGCAAAVGLVARARGRDGWAALALALLISPPLALALYLLLGPTRAARARAAARGPGWLAREEAETGL